MAKLCLIGCLDVDTPSVTGLHVLSAIKAFKPEVLIQALRPGPENGQGLASPGLAAIASYRGAYPFIFRKIDLGGMDAALRSAGFLAVEASVRQSLEALKKAGKLSRDRTLALNRIDESRSVYREIFEMPINRLNGPETRAALFIAQVEGLASLTGAAAWLDDGGEAVGKLGLIREELEKYRAATIKSIFRFLPDPPPARTALLCELAGKPFIFNALSASAASGGFTLVEFWD